MSRLWYTILLKLVQMRNQLVASFVERFKDSLQRLAVVCVSQASHVLGEKPKWPKQFYCFNAVRVQWTEGTLCTFLFAYYTKVVAWKSKRKGIDL